MALIADLSVRGVWAAQTEASFDICDMDTDAQPYTNRTVNSRSVFLSAENEKRKKYMEVVKARHVSFIPSICPWL